MLNSSSGRRKAENDSLQSEAVKSAHYNFFASILKLALVEKMGMFWANNFQMPSLLHEAVPADCCVKVITRNREEADILYQRGTPEPREAPRVVLKQAPRSMERPVGELISGWSDTQNIGQAGIKTLSKIVGVPQAIVQTNQARKQLICRLTKLYLGRPEKKKLMDELFINKDDACKPMCASAKEFFQKKQGNIKTFELCDSSQKVPREYWWKSMSTRQLYCECEEAFAPAFN